MENCQVLILKVDLTEYLKHRTAIMKEARKLIEDLLLREIFCAVPQVRFLFWESTVWAYSIKIGRCS